MNYGLAKQLKDAGFPQEGVGKFYCAGENGDQPLEIMDWPHKDGSHVYIPTLSEMIEACGEERIVLTRPVLGLWEAETQNWKSNGTTPEEAVGRLYIALHAKD